jgi:hypothetical protein
MKNDEQLAEELKRATEGLLFMSETDAPLEVVRLGAEPALNQQALMELAQAPAGTPVKQETADYFFRVAVSEPDWKTKEEIAVARRYQSLLRLLKENLTELSVYRIGSRRISVFILGKSAEGNWLGLRTRVVET